MDLVHNKNDAGLRLWICFNENPLLMREKNIVAGPVVFWPSHPAVARKASVLSKSDFWVVNLAGNPLFVETKGTSGKVHYGHALILGTDRAVETF